MRIRVYQINSERDNNRLKFMNYEFAMENGWSSKLYDMVYDGELKANSLEDVYTILNIGERPEDYKGHSLSVSDIVEVVNEDKSIFYFCDSFGWVKTGFIK